MTTTESEQVRMLRENELLKAENERLREALLPFIPPSHGDYGGPLVGVTFNYEDGSTIFRGHEVVGQAEAALAEGESDAVGPPKLEVEGARDYGLPPDASQRSM